MEIHTTPTWINCEHTPPLASSAKKRRPFNYHHHVESGLLEESREGLRTKVESESKEMSS
jgi:hypothetical protein